MIMAGVKTIIIYDNILDNRKTWSYTDAAEAATDLKKPFTIAPHISIDELVKGSSQQVRGVIEEYNRVITAQDLRIARLEQELKQRELELRLREEQLRLERIRKYGPKGEGLSHDQVMLLDLEPGVQEDEVAAEAALPDSDKQLKPPAQKSPPAKRYARAHPGRAALPAHLERREVIIPCEEGAGGEFMGYQDKEELVIKPAEFYVQLIRREKRRVRSGGRSTIITAPMPARIVEKGVLDDSVVEELVISKYCDHKPLYRQLKSWDRDYGLILDQAMAQRGVMAVGRLLQPLARHFGVKLKQGPSMQADETRVPVLQTGGKGRNDTAWFWQYSRPHGLVYFDYQSTRSRAGPGAFLSDYTGRLQSDGYEVYTPLGRRLHSHAGCWAHARRKFDEARKVAPKEAPCLRSQAMLDRIGELYAVEAEARDSGLKGEARLRLRQQRGVPAKLEAIKKAVVQFRQEVMPASQLGKACDYVLNQWEKLCVYGGDGEVEIDNNWCENAMRPVALGRKNWMHLGCQESGPVVAAIMSVIASAQRAGLNVRHYLHDVLQRLASRDFKVTQLDELLPENWKPLQSPAS